MSRDCYYLIHEDQWNRMYDVIQSIALVKSIVNGSPDRTQLEIMSDELSAFLAVIHRDLELLQNAPSKFLEPEEVT